MLNVDGHSLLLAPGERADVVVDFSTVPAGRHADPLQRLPRPAARASTPGTTTTPAPRTAPPPVGSAQPSRLRPEHPDPAPDPGGRRPGAPVRPRPARRAPPRAYAASQRPPIVPQPAYDPAFGTRTPRETLVPAHATSVSFTPAGRRRPGHPPARREVGRAGLRAAARPAVGRLGVGHPQPGPLAPATLPLGPADPATEVLFVGGPDGAGGRPGRRHPALADRAATPRRPSRCTSAAATCSWSTGSAGTARVRPPDANELGWKETVRVDPGEDVVVALRPVPPDPAIQDRRQRTAARPDPAGRRPARASPVSPLDGGPPRW